MLNAIWCTEQWNKLFCSIWSYRSWCSVSSSLLWQSQYLLIRYDIILIKCYLYFLFTFIFLYEILKKWILKQFKIFRNIFFWYIFNFRYSFCVTFETANSIFIIHTVYKTVWVCGVFVRHRLVNVMNTVGCWHGVCVCVCVCVCVYKHFIIQLLQMHLSVFLFGASLAVFSPFLSSSLCSLAGLWPLASALWCQL